MSDRFTCCPIDRLLQWILEEEKQGQIFGIRQELFLVPQPDDAFKMQRYGQALETPIGVAAGPHTQLSQNIISAWLTGARYIELKTIQTLDELEVTSHAGGLGNGVGRLEAAAQTLLGELLPILPGITVVPEHIGHRRPPATRQRRQ